MIIPPPQDGKSIRGWLRMCLRQISYYFIAEGNTDDSIDDMAMCHNLSDGIRDK